MKVRLATRRDLDDVVATLVAGFDQDPVFRWFFPDPGRYEAALGRWLKTICGFAFQHGHIYLDDIQRAAAVWIPPDLDLVSDAERTQLIEMLASEVSEAHAMEVAGVVGAAAGHHPVEPPSFLLAYVAVRPEARGAGLGAEVLRPVMDRIDHDGLDSYLHSTNVRNVPFYERLGWRVIAEVPAGDSGASIRPMWRDPRS